MRPRHPVPQRRVLAGAMLVGLMLGGIVLLGDLLRHPPPSGGVAQPPDVGDGDPRLPVECPTRRAGPGSGLIEVTSNDLYDCPQLYDGTRVRYRGEAIGHVLTRRRGAWIQLNDDVYAGDIGPLPAHRDFRGGNAGVGVLVPRDLAASLRVLGGPSSRGDVLEVVGTFHRVDDRGEIAVIHADQGRVVQTGEPLHDPPLRDRQVAAAVALALALGSVTMAWRFRRR